MAEVKDSKTIQLRCFCVILALVCAFCLVVLSVHSCEQCDCLWCALQSSCKGIWQCSAIIAPFQGAALLTECRNVEQESADASTLVTLKVKLSN